MLPASVARFRMDSEAIRAKSCGQAGEHSPDDGGEPDVGQGRRRPDGADIALDPDVLEILPPGEEGQVRVPELVGLGDEKIRSARDQNRRTGIVFRPDGEAAAARL